MEGAKHYAIQEVNIVAERGESAADLAVAAFVHGDFPLGIVAIF